MGGSTGKSDSDSESYYSEDVWGGQSGPLQDLYQRAGGLFDQMTGYYGDLRSRAEGLDPYNDQLMDRGLEGQENLLGGGSMGDTTEIRNELMDSLRRTAGGSNMGRMYESIVGGAGNTYIDPMVDAMKQGSMDNLSRMQAGTGLDATAAGQSGSSRHAMQNAMLGKEANQDMLNKEMQMRGGAYDKDLAMKMGIAQQADTGVQNTQNMLYNMLGSADQNVGAGMNAGSGLQNLGMGSMAPFMQAANAPWDIMKQYANVIGRPTVLGSGSGSGSSSSKSAGASLKG